MRTKYITLLVALALLSGCGSDAALHSAAPQSEELRALVAEQQRIQPTASFQLTTPTLTYRSGEEFDVTVQVNNPAGKTIDSVRSWLAFDPEKLQVVALHSEQSNFDLALAQENLFDNGNGVVAIGRSSQQPYVQTSGTVQVVTFRVLPTKTEKVTTIDFYDYQPTAAGHTGVYEVQNGNSYNIGLSPAAPALRLTLRPAIKR